LTRPAPLTPADSDLRDFQFMPLDVVRFAQSDLVAFAPAEAVVAAILLWGASWHGRPAASLTNDDRTLASLAGFGRGAGGLRDWLEVKEEALRGFVECSDGRLYHPVVAEKAREAWRGKLAQRHRTFLAACRKHNERNPNAKVEGPDFDAWDRMGRPREVAALLTEPPREPTLPLPGGGENEENDANVTRDTGGKSRVTKANVTQIQGSKGEGQGEGQGEGDSYINHTTGETRERDERTNDDPKLDRKDILDLTQRLTRVASVRFDPIRLGPFNREISIVEGWLKDGIDPEATIVPAIANRLAKTEQQSIGSLRFFDADVRKAHAKGGGNGKTGKTMSAADLERYQRSTIETYRKIGRHEDADALERQLGGTK